METEEGKQQERNESLSPNMRVVTSPALQEDILAISPEFDGTLTQEMYDQICTQKNDKVLSNSDLYKLAADLLTYQYNLYGVEGEHPYHDIEHSSGVTALAKNVVGILKRRANPINDADAQIFILAAVAHDLGHCGRTLRQFDPETGEKLTIDDGRSNEQQAVFLADPILKKEGFSIRQRLHFQSLILATTFDERQPNAIPDEEKFPPQTHEERLMSIIDLGDGALMEDEVEFLDRTMKVLFAEKPQAKWPRNMTHWLQTMNGFWKFVEMRMKGADGEIIPEAEALFGEVFRTRKKMFAMLTSEDPSTKAEAERQFEELLSAAHAKFQPYFEKLKTAEPDAS
ncbi:MAG: HD domain-containing protein [Candidatus Peregrinibacteria bacterium]|nr:HD domain-containing protein [Candidatus Peregrinibacteria bacterium]MDZ4245465.1 HD domain-containing protein [Candidatus Gracilibacteria bacterium]